MRLRMSMALAGVTLFSVCLFAQSEPWKPGEFGGLETGTSNRKDMLRVFGNAVAKKTARVEIYRYPGKGDFGGDVSVEVGRRTGVVESITVQWSPNITRTQAYKKFGRVYDEVHYSIAKCGDGVNPPVYRDPNGALELIEYPDKGTILWPNQMGFDFAAAVFRAKPLPKIKPSCK